MYGNRFAVNNDDYDVNYDDDDDDVIDDEGDDVYCDVQGGSLLAMTLMLILRHDHVTLYIGTCLFGLFLSSITPTALAVAEMYIELSGQ